MQRNVAHLTRPAVRQHAVGAVGVSGPPLSANATGGCEIWPANRGAGRVLEVSAPPGGPKIAEMAHGRSAGSNVSGHRLDTGKGVSMQQ